MSRKIITSDTTTNEVPTDLKFPTESSMEQQVKILIEETPHRHVAKEIDVHIVATDEYEYLDEYLFKLVKRIEDLENAGSEFPE